MFRVAFVGVDNPHGSGWRDLLVNLEDQLQIVALVPGYDGGTTSLEERYAHLPRFDTVDALLAGCEFDGAVVCLSNQQGPEVLCQLAAAGKHLLAENSFDEARDIETELLVEVSWLDRQGEYLMQRGGSADGGKASLEIGQAVNFVPEAGQSLATAHQEAIQKLARQIVDQMELRW